MVIYQFLLSTLHGGILRGCWCFLVAEYKDIHLEWQMIEQEEGF